MERLLAVPVRNLESIEHNQSSTGFFQYESSEPLSSCAHDVLTGLHIRESLLQVLQSRIDNVSAHSMKYALLFLDIDGFKRINDSLGHVKADAVLIEVGRRLNEAVEGVPGTVVARLGGDEFVVLMSDVESEEDAVTFGGFLEFLLRTPIVCGRQQVFITASVGISFGAQGAYREAFQMLEDSDLAMYRAKAYGKGRCIIYSETMRQEAITRLELEIDLRCALSKGEFELHYQPKVAMETGTVKGFEALVRWRHPVRGLVPPDVFISIAEDIGLIGAIGRWVASEAIGQLAKWRNENVVGLDATMAVNVSTRQFRESDLLDWMMKQLVAAHVPSQCLVLEITESLLIEDSPSSLRLLQSIVDAGIGLDLDDFGTGYSSLSYLDRFPFRSIKLDRSFVKRMGEDRNSINLVASIVSLAGSLGMKVIAEGVETREQAGHLRQMGCSVAQGYLFSPALPAKDMEGLLLKNHCRFALKGQPASVVRFPPKGSRAMIPLRHAMR